MCSKALGLVVSRNRRGSLAQASFPCCLAAYRQGCAARCIATARRGWSAGAFGSAIGSMVMAPCLPCASTAPAARPRQAPPIAMCRAAEYLRGAGRGPVALWQLWHDRARSNLEPLAPTAEECREYLGAGAVGSAAGPVGGWRAACAGSRNTGDPRPRRPSRPRRSDRSSRPLLGTPEAGPGQRRDLQLWRRHR
jgi:hypothetical protein